MKTFHVIKVKYHGPTSVSIISDRFDCTRIISYDHTYDSAYETAESWLIKEGFNIIGVGEGKDCMYLISDTFESF